MQRYLREETGDHKIQIRLTYEFLPKARPSQPCTAAPPCDALEAREWFRFPIKLTFMSSDARKLSISGKLYGSAWNVSLFFMVWVSSQCWTNAYWTVISLSNSPLKHVIILSSPTEIHVWETVDQFEIFLPECNSSSEHFLVEHSATTRQVIFGIDPSTVGRF